MSSVSVSTCLCLTVGTHTRTRTQTLHRHALAWGDFRIYGRVRAWDGLVVLVRTPIWHGPGLPPHDTFIFRGYLVGGPRGNLVGSWRHVTGNVHSIPLEGPFVVSRLDERELAGGNGTGDAGVREGGEGEGVGAAAEQQPAQDIGDVQVQTATHA